MKLSGIKEYIKKFLEVILKILIILAIIFMVISYYIKKILNLNIYNKKFYHNDYNKHNKKIIEIYGKYKIKNIYIVNETLTPLLEFGLNISTLYNIKQNNIYPKHISMIIEIELDNKLIKKILLEKNNYINIQTNFAINEKNDIKKIKCKNLNYTLETLLSITQKRMKNNKFFNWHIKDNNCQLFIKELLITIKKYNKQNKKYIFQDNIHKINYSELNMYMFNSINNIGNLIESL